MRYVLQKRKCWAGHKKGRFGGGGGEKRPSFLEPEKRIKKKKNLPSWGKGDRGRGKQETQVGAARS